MSAAPCHHRPRQPFAATYLAGSCGILAGLRDELAQVEELAARAAHVVRAGGTVYASLNFGHLAQVETAPARHGNPGIMKAHGGWASTDFDIVGPGDMVFTNDCARKVRAARDRGGYIVAVTTCYINNEFRAAGLTCPNEDDLLLRDVASEVLHSHVPAEQGLCRAAEIPNLTLCPSVGTGTGALFWMLNAALASRLADEPGARPSRARQYLDVLGERVEALEEYVGPIQELAQTMAERVLAGGTWHVRSPEFAGLESELHWVECGPMIVNNGPWEAARPNILLLSAVSPAHPEEVALAVAKEREGALVVAIAPTRPTAPASSGSLLAAVAAGFDSLSPEPDGVIRIDSHRDAICPTTALVANIIQQMICAQWTEEMICRGASPGFFRGINQVGGRDHNAAGMQRFHERGY